MTSKQLEVQPIRSPELGRINRVYLSQSKYRPDKFFISVNEVPYVFETDAALAEHAICLNNAQRNTVKARPGSLVSVNYIEASSLESASLIKISIDSVKVENRTVERNELIEIFMQTYKNFPFKIKQEFYFLTSDLTLLAKVEEILTPNNFMCGVLRENCVLHISSSSDKLILVGGEKESALLRKDFSFKELGIGGLQNEFGVMFRRAFVQRAFDSKTIQQLGIPHVKGILLYGPPGTGKTLIARQIGKLLQAKPPKIVNGPEILNKYVGQSEENLRALFVDAEEDYKKYKHKSPLHIIIFDELDAIFKTRGQSAASSGISDQIVNQLLAKMDGVEALDNILIIGMTNRPDMIDKALLRPGRFEIHIEIILPDEKGRLEILEIHTKSMSDAGILQPDVNISEVAKLSRNFTGAELQALIKSAASFALERNVKAQNLDEKTSLTVSDQVEINMGDFVSALDEIKPAYGYNSEEFQLYNKIFYELPTFTDGLTKFNTYMHKLRHTNAYTTSSIIFYGARGTGKTNLAVKAALSSDCPFIKLISPKMLVGLSENDKVNFIKERFQDAYKSAESIVILDEIETLIDFVSIGPRFSNPILQAIKIFIKNEEKNKLFVIATSSEKDLLDECGILDCFYTTYEVKSLDARDFEALCDMNADFKEIAFEKPRPIKTVLSKLNAPPSAFS